MQIGAEISLYPLAEDFASRIEAFLARLGTAGRLKIVTTSLSTQVFGDYDEVVGTLARELRTAFAQAPEGGRVIATLKLFGPLADLGP